MSKGDRKSDYFSKVHALFRQYRKAFIVGIDNVGSSQMHLIRASIRDQAVLLMGKNTMIKKAMKDIVPEMPDIESLFPYIKGNVGFVFTNGDLKTVRDAMVSHKIAAPAKVGSISQCTVSIPAGNTGISPDKTSFFQALGISTKVVKGAIEILNDVLILKEGDRVGASESELLGMLNIMPFTYGIVCYYCYDNGAIFEPEMLDVTDNTLLSIYNKALNSIAALSLRVSFPTAASIPHSVIAGFKNLLAVSLSSEYSFPASEKLKHALANRDSFVPAHVSTEACSSSGITSVATSTVEEAKAEESDEEMGFGLFD